MTKIYETETHIKWVSKDRPNSLIFRISGTLKEIMNLNHNDKLKIEIHIDDGKKYLKLYKED